MLLKLLRYVMVALVLMLVFMASALVAMRFAIQGREVRVPSLTGLTMSEAERSANAAGVVLLVENRFYSPLPQGQIVSQMPEPGTRVRRGWRIVAAESLGPQRIAIPNVIGQSEHAADINIRRRGLEPGSVATMQMPGVQPGTVLAQSPSPASKEAASPRISLLVAGQDNAQMYVMPSFVGKALTDVAATLTREGFSLGKLSSVPDDANQRGSGIIVRQYPRAGQRIAAGATINFDVSQ